VAVVVRHDIYTHSEWSQVYDKVNNTSIIKGIYRRKFGGEFRGFRNPLFRSLSMNYSNKYFILHLYMFQVLNNNSLESG
jgi:hypothetical protein